jgi:chitinase
MIMPMDLIPISGHHTNLYTSSKDTSQYSAHRAIQEFMAAGVPPSKIVMGIAFYGRAGKWNQATITVYTGRR